MIHKERWIIAIERKIIINKIDRYRTQASQITIPSWAGLDPAERTKEDQEKIIRIKGISMQTNCNLKFEKIIPSSKSLKIPQFIFFSNYGGGILPIQVGTSTAIYLRAYQIQELRCGVYRRIILRTILPMNFNARMVLQICENLSLKGHPGPSGLPL